MVVLNVCEHVPLNWHVYTDVSDRCHLAYCGILLSCSHNRLFSQLNISVHVTNLENVHKFTQYTHFSVLLQNIACVDWTIYSWQGFNSIGCPLMLRTNYRCVRSLNISVDVAKCVENVHKFTQYTHFLSVTKTTSPDWKICSWQGFNSLGCPVMPRTNYSHSTSV